MKSYEESAESHRQWIERHYRRHPKKGVKKKTMVKIWNSLQGKKSYIVAGLMIVYAILAVYFQQMTWQQAIQWVFGSGALIAIKSALAKLQN